MKTIRAMDGRDVESIVDIERQSFSPWSREQIAAELLCADSIVLVVGDCSGGVVLGWCCARIVGPEAELLKIAVLPDSRQNGFGSSLLEKLCLNLFSYKVEALFLEVRSRNRTAISFYLKHGFHEVGERPGYYSHPKDNALIFRKELLYSGC